MRIALYIISTVVIFLIGWTSHKIIRREDTTDYHWKKINDWREYMSDPNNTRTSMGFTNISQPFDEMPHLEALVSAGELQKRWVLIPGLPVRREVTQDLMKFLNNPQVLSATMGEHYNDGVPLTFQVWYRPSFDQELSNYIEELKNKG